MKSFKEYNNSIITISKLLLESKNDISLSDFIESVSSYNNIDDALYHLDDKYAEFYIKNINNKKLQKELKKLKLLENWNTEINADQNLGMSPKPEKIKKIHYKGHYIVLKFDPNVGWVPYISFKNVTKSLQFIKNLFDDYA